MQQFMDKDFLLETEAAKTLYHEYAAKMPVVDYHCHISPQEIYENKQYKDISEVWLGGDHYKWRLMRVCGVDEEKVTGSASGWEKFEAFASVLPKAPGNPVYHWAHLELQRYFGVTKPLCPATAKEIWDTCNAKLQEEGMRVRGIIERSNVTTVATTDDPIDDLQWHKKLAADESFKAKVVPAFRPDKAMNIEKAGFVEYIAALSGVVGYTIDSVEKLEKALASRVDYFDEVGCRASDQGIDSVTYVPASREEVEAIFQRGLAGEALTLEEANAFRFQLFVFLGKEYAKHDWVMEVHFGAMRNVNTPQFNKLGADTGYDCISPNPGMTGLAKLLDELYVAGQLPRTIIFSLNPIDNAAINTLCGTFHEKGVAGKVQQGSAWWFNDTMTGMIEQMTSFCNLSALGNFVGMLTDSRSFLSYTRHEYFRRILCNLLGGWIEKGMFPADMEQVGAMVQDISYNNAMKFFKF